MTFPPFTVRFIRDTDDSSTDSVVKIVPVSNNQYEWIYRESDRSNLHMMTLLSFPLHARMEVLLKMLEFDIDPVKEVQIDAPGCPQVLFKHCDIPKMSRNILDILSQTMRFWPTSVNRNLLNHVDNNFMANSNYVFNEDVSDISDSESMPPLVREW